MLFQTSILSTPAFAAGPVIVHNGMALHYNKRPLIYRFDEGNLGKLSNEEARKLVEELFNIWRSVKTSSFEFKTDHPESVGKDINAENYKTFLKPRRLLGFSPIVFDEDGSIISSLFGEQAANIILGFGGPLITKRGSRYSVTESQIVLNGRFINGVENESDPEVEIERFKRAILHEIGHAIGLDHSQINVEAIAGGVSFEESIAYSNSTPLMFPSLTNNIVGLHQDDISSISFLYPDEKELANYGIVKGKVVREDGKTPILGANVITRNIADPLLTAISCVSDFLATMTGEFTLYAIPPGNYTIEIEPINPIFSSGLPEKRKFQGTISKGSGIGPYSANLEDESFKNPVTKGYYTGNNIISSPKKEDSLIINVEANKTINVNIIAK